MWLARNGFANVHNLRGGVEAWALEVDPGMRALLTDFLEQNAPQLRCRASMD